SAGRAPDTDDEIALGRLTMEKLGASIGSTVSAHGPDGPVTLRVTGVVVLPTLANYTGADRTTLGEGAVISGPTLSKISNQFSPVGVAVDLMPGHSVDQLLATAPDIGVPSPVVASDPERPADVSNIAKVQSAPIVLAVLVGIVALVTVGEALFSAV